MFKYIRFFKYLFLHKYYVAIECFKRGLVWQGIIHDCSKFLPDEFIPYSKYLYESEEKKRITKNEWLLAVARHYSRNPHHCQYWGEKEMPLKYRQEMISDWIAASRIKNGGGLDLDMFWKKNRNVFKMGKTTKKWVDKEVARVMRLYKNGSYL